MAKEKIVKDPLEAILANIEKQMGNKDKPVMTRFGNIEVTPTKVIPFGLSAIDDASYCGGLGRGKLVEIFGPESSGKSLLTLYLIAQAQKQGLDCALLDIEQSFDPVWAASKGVDVPKLIYSNTFNNGEQALEYAYLLCKCGKLGLVVIDSTAALIPQAELEGSLEDNARVGAQAQIISRGTRKIVDACGKGDTTCVFINQLRMKIGVKWGNPETTPGGLSLKFYSHQRLRVDRKQKITVKENGKDVVVGQISQVVFVKNKVARPFGRAEFTIVFDAQSLNPVVMLCNAAREAKLIRTYKQLFNIDKEVTGKKIETNAASINDLADYLVKNDLVLTLLEKVIEEYDMNKEELGKLDDAILEMKEDASKIVSPNDASVAINAVKIDDASKDDLGDDAVEVAEKDLE